MQFKYVTSMNRRIYRDYGENMLTSFVENWPEGRLTVYTEDGALPFVHDRVEYKNFWDIPGAEQFTRSLETFPIFRGNVDGQYNYRYNVYGFSKKVFAWMDAVDGYEGYLFWIDADVQTLKPIPGALLEDWMQGNFMCVMRRKGWHLCSSFFGIDCMHSFTLSFMQQYYSLWITGKFLGLEQWDDAFVLERALEQIPGVKDIAEAHDGDGPYNVFDMVFGEYAKHLKGNLKGQVVMSRYAQLLGIVQQLQPAKIIEVGTWRGDRAIEFHKVAPKAQYVGFDLFEDATAETDADERNVKPHYTLESVTERLKQAGVSFKLYKGDTRETFTAYATNGGVESLADIVFIDGGHSVETITSDLKNAEMAVKPGGIIVMDDYYSEMPPEDLAAYGAQAVLQDRQFELLPIKDKVAGGGKVQMALIRC